MHEGSGGGRGREWLGRGETETGRCGPAHDEWQRLVLGTRKKRDLAAGVLTAAGALLVSAFTRDELRTNNLLEQTMKRILQKQTLA